MAEILSLSKARKTKAKAEKETRAAENRVTFGRTKAEKAVEKARTSLAEKSIDAHQREPQSSGPPNRPRTMKTLYDFTETRLLGGTAPLSEYAGKVALIVNVASHCGNTPQYEGLEALYERYGKDGLVVMGFPCNQFEGQEPGTAQEIADFCTGNFGVQFPMFGKIDVNGPNADPLYRWLKRETPGSDDRDIEWNFAKFLIGRDGRPVKRFRDKVLPADITPDIERLL